MGWCGGQGEGEAAKSERENVRGVDVVWMVGSGAGRHQRRREDGWDVDVLVAKAVTCHIRRGGGDGQDGWCLHEVVACGGCVWWLRVVVAEDLESMIPTRDWHPESSLKTN
eukprot:361815-Chlamydomonas_euryale.AAC.3